MFRGLNVSLATLFHHLPAVNDTVTAVGVVIW